MSDEPTMYDDWREGRKWRACLRYAVAASGWQLVAGSVLGAIVLILLTSS